MKRIIIGVLGNESQNKKQFVSLCTSNGFHPVKISDKVKELAGYLFNHDDDFELDDKTLNSLRDRGYKVNSMYWINLLLSSMNNDYKHVVLEDMREEDMIPGVIYHFDTDKMGLSDMEKQIKQLLKK